MTRNLVCTLLLFCLASIFPGCGPARRPTVKTAPVAGTVTLDGSPLEGAQVNFLGEKYAGIATTDASGHYELEAQPGENTVYLSKFKGVGPDFDETMLGGGDTPGAGPEQLLPKKYSDPVDSELRFPVPEDGSTEANFELTSR